MNILPDYLIEYMPTIEAALEELRLSVLDHAYELLQKLDIDELSTDDVRQKLELYDIKVDNMSGYWLPNGRFYRLYPSIKHHRSRYNAIKAIAKSGGQFEGLWSTDFNNKSTYQFNSIQLARHYELQSDADGYFFISGNTSRSADGKIISSAAQSLSTDILINQALPAGYTYLYVPWPRPMYPSDSSYFYNVNMLMYDRLHYANDCDHLWILLQSLSDKDIYYCLENSLYNRYCEVPHTITEVNIILYGSSVDTSYNLVNSHQYSSLEEDGALPNDAPFTNEMYDESYPASKKYNWGEGDGTPWRTPYWIDYHFMNNMHRELPNSDSAGQWPVVESGNYYDVNGDIALDKKEAVTYTLDSKCSALNDTKSVFPTKCYLKERLKTTEPNRLQTFTPSILTLTIRNFNIPYNSNFEELLCKTLYIDVDDLGNYVKDYYKGLSCTFEIVDSEVIVDGVTSHTYTVKTTLTDSDYASYTGNLSISYICNNQEILTFSQFTNGIYESEVFTEKINVSEMKVCDPSIVIFIVNESMQDTFEKGIANLLASDHSFSCDYEFTHNTEYSIDENYFKEPDRLALQSIGPYRFDKLYDGFLYYSNDKMNHFKAYRPFWNEKTPWLDMCQSNTDSNENHSLYHWMNLKQTENVPSIPFNLSDSEVYDLGTNKPPISEITFTSYDRPTRGKLDSVDALYTRAENDSQYNNKTMSSTVSDNLLYFEEESTQAEIDPELSCTIVNLSKLDEDNGNSIIYSDNILSYIEIVPSSKLAFFNLNNDVHSDLNLYNYCLYKTSKFHKSYFRSDKSDRSLSSGVNKLYNQQGNDELYILGDNTVKFTFTIYGLYDSNNNKVEFDSSGLDCTIFNNKYNIFAIKTTNTDSISGEHIPVTASYIIYTVDIKPGVTQIAAEYKVFATNIETGVSYKANYIPSMDQICVDIAGTEVYEEYIPMSEFYESYTLDSTGDSPVDGITTTSNSDTLVLYDTPFVESSYTTRIGFSRSAEYQTLDNNLASGDSGYLYDEGSSSFSAVVEGATTYTISKIYNAASVELSSTGISIIVSGTSLKLSNSSENTLAWNRVEYIAI